MFWHHVIFPLNGGFKINGGSKHFFLTLGFFKKSQSQENIVLSKIWTPLILKPPFKGKIVIMADWGSDLNTTRCPSDWKPQSHPFGWIFSKKSMFWTRPALQGEPPGGFLWAALILPIFHGPKLKSKVMRSAKPYNYLLEHIALKELLLDTWMSALLCPVTSEDGACV
jgi:hypothetical protein